MRCFGWDDIEHLLHGNCNRTLVKKVILGAGWRL
jgi:hypothetical protein